MSSQRRQAGRPAAAPPPERKAPAGPVITPQILSVFFFIVLVIAVWVMISTVVKKGETQVSAANARKTTAEANAATYKKKGARLEVAKKLDKVVRDKLHDTAYMFMTDQSSMIPFWDDTLF